MIDTAFVELIVNAALIVMVFLLIPCTYRVVVGPSTADRLQAIDTITTLLIGIVVLLAVVQDVPYLVDAAIALAAFSFIATMSIARYLCEGRVF